jgi:recombinational DNA repair protein RecR
MQHAADSVCHSMLEFCLSSAASWLTLVLAIVLADRTMQYASVISCRKQHLTTCRCANGVTSASYNVCSNGQKFAHQLCVRHAQHDAAAEAQARASAEWTCTAA